MDMVQYTDLFVSEAQDHLQEMSRLLLAVEEALRTRTAPVEQRQVAGLFRAAHTLKGMAASLGFQEVATMAHRMEDVLELLRQGKRTISPAMVDALFAGLDQLGGLVDCVASGRSEVIDVTQVLARLDSLLNETPPQSVTGQISAQPEAQLPAWELCLGIAADCQLKGPRAYVAIRRLSGLAMLVAGRPPEAELLAGKYADGFSLFFAAGADPQALLLAAGHITEVVSANLIPVQPPEVETPVQAAAAAPGAEAPGVLLPETPAPGSVMTQTENPDVMPAEPGPQAQASWLSHPAPTSPHPPASPEVSSAEPGAGFVRLKVGLLDQLLEAAADMVVNHSLLMQIARRHNLPDLKDGLETHAAAIKRLEQVVLSMRMVPVAQVFNRFPRLVRDLSVTLGKDVHFEMEGAEIELDRVILDRLVDPLVHLLRNALDHGVELPAERIHASKPLPASVRLAARREQNAVLIEVSDDGRGISPETILKTALDRGILTPIQAAGLDSHAILELICLPGFSTKAQTSDLSGRGVGMDVVRQTLNELGGGLEIESQPGQGSLFRLICPLTMAILPAILVRSGPETYAIPLSHVAQTLDLEPDEIRSMYTRLVLSWKGLLLPLYPLAQCVGVAGAAAAVEAIKASSQPVQVVVLNPGRQVFGLVVDEILGKEDIVLKPLSRYLGAIPGLSGVTLRGEGEIVLVLDVAGLVQSPAVGGRGGVDE